MELLARDPVFINKNNIVDAIGDSDSEISGVKYKNMIMLDFLTKSKLLVDPSSGTGFLTPGARLTFIKLR